MVDERRLDVFSRTVAAIDEGLSCQHGRGLAIDLIARALSYERNVGPIPEPVQVLEDARLVFRMTALAIVVLDPQEYVRPGGPHVLRVEHVPEMEPARRCGCEAREHGNESNRRLAAES